MALPTVIAKNQTGTGILLTRLGLTCPASPGTITLTDFATFFEVASDEVLENRVGIGDIVINDGDSDLSIPEALGYLDATGNLNGPVSGLVAGRLLRLADTTGRYTDALAMKYYDPSATDPVSPAPADGDLYYNTALSEEMIYDGARTKWLSISGITLMSGATGGTAAGSYFRGMDGLAYGTNIGHPVPKGTLTGIALTRTNATASTLDVYVGGSVIASLTITAGAGLKTNWAVNADFAEGFMQFRNRATGGSVSNAQITALVKRRA